MNKKYVIGIDYGTLSARAVLVDCLTGKEIAERTENYSHAVMDFELPSGKKLPKDYALQHPTDYLDCLKICIQGVLNSSGISAQEIGGLGIDFTACTVLPVDDKFIPLCTKKEYENEPHAYVKLWKHHSAQPYADEINALANERGESWIKRYGGKISSEWAFPKLLQILREAPEIYSNTFRFLEAGDWLSYMLTGEETHSAVFAGYKALWSEKEGYPSNDFWKALDPHLDGVIGTKISTKVYGMDKIAGYISENGAKLCGLEVGTPVALPMIDAHSAMPALNITADGDLMLIVGTSACHILNSSQIKEVEGICGYVYSGVIPGLYTYEAGQAGVGDNFEWFIKNCLPGEYFEKAKGEGLNIHAYLRKQLSSQKVGESGLIALDWWNGNRSILVDSELSGMILGMTLQTKPEDIYRAILESNAFGLKVIVEQYEKSGIEIKNICAAGGIAVKDEFLMQIYADVLNKEIRIAGSTQAGALGSAIYASVAGGIYPDVVKASQNMSCKSEKVYKPILENVKEYEKLYAEYVKLHDYFGKENGIMKKLRRK